MKLVSRANGLEGEPANEPGEGTGVEHPSISGNGRYVIFTSAASNLVSGLPSAALEEHPVHVYRHDLQTSETVLVDRVTGKQGAILGERGPRAEAISGDGRYVLFRDGVEDLENLAGSHEPGLNTVYVRDMQAATTTAVSRADGASGELANESSRGTSISPEGRYVAFEGSATNLVPGMQSNTVSQVYLRDLQTGSTTLASKTPTGEPANGPSGEPLLVGGCQVAFSSEATNLYVYEANPSSPQRSTSLTSAPPPPPSPSSAAPTDRTVHRPPKATPSSRPPWERAQTGATSSSAPSQNSPAKRRMSARTSTCGTSTPGRPRSSIVKAAPQAKPPRAILKEPRCRQTDAASRSRRRQATSANHSSSRPTSATSPPATKNQA